ncbi:MAG: hypothetical protein AB7G88_09445 [Thermomicrobiales bacterium]
MVDTSTARFWQTNVTASQAGLSVAGRTAWDCAAGGTLDDRTVLEIGRSNVHYRREVGGWGTGIRTPTT